MKRLSVILIVLLFGFKGFGQNDDSTVVNKVNDNYIEIQSLRHTLKKWNTSEYGSVKENLVPQPIVINNGVVFIKDRLNRPLAFYYYSNSIIVHYEEYEEGILRRQEFIYSDSNGIDISFWKNGNIKEVLEWSNGQTKNYHYSKDGQIIDYQQDNYSELIRNGDNSFFRKEYNKSLDFYEKATLMKPNEDYPKSQIKILNTLINK